MFSAAQVEQLLRPVNPRRGISYALKRCAKDLGDQFGLSLYNKGSVAALVGRTLALRVAGDAFKGGPAAEVDADLPELAPDWDEQPPGREDGLPVNADGSLSRSRTSDAEKDAAGVMTSAQLAEHTALQPKASDGRSTRLAAVPDDDPWYDGGPGQPLPPLKAELATAQQRKAYHAAFRALGVEDRAERIKITSEVMGRLVVSSSDLTREEMANMLTALSRLMADGKRVKT